MMHPGSFSVAGAPARSLAERFGTPLFVYDEGALRARYREILGAFDYSPVRVHYAAVCNPNLHLLRVLCAEGAGLHANTPGDVFCGLRAGFRGEDIVFSGSNLGDEDLACAAAAGVHVNVDSLDDLERACRAPALSLGLRVHLEGILPESRMGVREAELPAAAALAARAGRRLTSLHVYCGTHGQSVSRYQAAAARLVELAELLPEIDCLNLGGGFGFDYHTPDEQPFPFAEIARAGGEAARALSARLGRPITLRLEPGRTMIAAAGVLLTRVRSIKRAGGRRYVGVDTTTANFTSPVVHGAHRRVVAVDEREPEAEPADVCGCTTYSRDFVARDCPLPGVRVGDLLAVLDVGAYGYCMASHFLNRPRPAEVLVSSGEPRLITRRETFEDLVTLQASW